MRIRDFAGPGGCSGVTARATDERWVAARAALLLRVVRQLRGVEPASAVRGPAAGRARRPPRRRGRATASARPRSLPVPSTRRRWAVVSLAFAAGRRPSVLAVRQTPAAGGVRRSRGATWHVGRGSRGRTTAGARTSRVAGAAWRSSSGELASARMSDGARAISRGASSATAPAWTHPSSGAVGGEGGSPSRGRGGAGSGAPPSARSHQSTERPPPAGLPARGRTVRRCATSVRRAPARRSREGASQRRGPACRGRWISPRELDGLPSRDAARLRVSHCFEHRNQPSVG
jgi:hypothetical protein